MNTLVLLSNLVAGTLEKLFSYFSEHKAKIVTICFRGEMLLMVLISRNRYKHT